MQLTAEQHQLVDGAKGQPVEAAPGDPMRIKLRELPMPPEVAERVRRHCKATGRRYLTRTA